MQDNKNSELKQRKQFYNELDPAEIIFNPKKTTMSKNNQKMEQLKSI